MGRRPKLKPPAPVDQKALRKWAFTYLITSMLANNEWEQCVSAAGYRYVRIKIRQSHPIAVNQ